MGPIASLCPIGGVPKRPHPSRRIINFLTQLLNSLAQCFLQARYACGMNRAHQVRKACGMRDNTPNNIN